MLLYTLSTFCFRIRNKKQGGAWCPKEEVSKESFEYLQIDLGELRVITIIETQGHFGHGQVRYAKQQNNYYLPITVIITMHINDNCHPVVISKALHSITIASSEYRKLLFWIGLEIRRDSGTSGGRRISNTRGPREVADSQILGDLRIVGVIRR